MTSLLANRSARRRGIAYMVLLAMTLLMMAFSSNPGVREFQNGIGFAFRPIQGALDTVAGGIASIGAAITEIDRLRIDNAALHDENERLANENARLQETRRENDQLTALLQLQSGFDFKTTAASVIGREPSEFRRRITLDKGTDDGLALGDVRDGRRRRARRTDHRDRAGQRDGHAADRRRVDRHRAARPRMPRRARSSGQLGGVLVMNQIDSSQQVGLNDEVVTAGITLASGIRSPYPKGLLIGQVVDVRRDANDVVQTAFLRPTADLDRLEYVLVILDYEGGLPPIEQQPVDCSGVETLPVGEQPCFTPTPKPPAATPTPKP